MILFPAIDLVAGQVVRLKRGERSQMDIYSNDPAGVAESFRDVGAHWIHVVDLSAAFGEDCQACAKNRAVIKQICAVDGISVDAGGGIRSMQDLERMFDLGVSRVAIGTALVRDPTFVEKAISVFGDKLVADVAARGGEVRISGWRQDSCLSVDELIPHLADLGFSHLVFTDVARDGMQIGLDAKVYSHIAQQAGFPVVASGGIATLDDLRALQALGPAVIEGAIVGRALYEHAFSLEDALALSES